MTVVDGKTGSNFTLTPGLGYRVKPGMTKEESDRILYWMPGLSPYGVERGSSPA